METASPRDPYSKIYLAHQFRARIKELACLYAIFDIANKPSNSIYQVIQEIVNEIPSAFPEREKFCVRVTIGPKVIPTDNCNNCTWKFDTSITADEKSIGTLETGYLGESPQNGSPLLEEAKEFLKLVAFLIGIVIQSKSLGESLELSEQRYRKLVDHYPVGVFRSNLDGDLLYANAACLRMFGYESLQAAIDAGGTLAVYKNPADREAMMKILEQTGKLADCEAECLSRTGESVFVLASATLESDVITAMLMDITARRQTEIALEGSEKRFRKLADNALVGIFQTNLKGEALYANDRALRMFDYESLEEAMAAGGSLGVYLHLEDRKRLVALLRKTGNVENFEVELKTKAKEPIFVLLSADLESDVITGMMMDITRRKKVEEEHQALMKSVQEERERLATLVSSMTEEVWFADTRKNFILANRAALKEFNLDASHRIDIRKLTRSLEVLRPDGSPRPEDEAPPFRSRCFPCV
jgi:PAS domain S-box-containing protein